jgi:hypothetical protein
LHPQAPAGPEPAITHAEPWTTFPAQLAHVAPAAPQALWVSVVWHVPLDAALQQVPLQGWLDEHDAVHVWFPRSHAWPTGQPLDAEHPASPIPVSTPVSTAESLESGAAASPASPGTVESTPESTTTLPSALDTTSSVDASAEVPPSISERSKLTRSSHPVVAKPATAKTPTSSSARFRSVIAFLQVWARPRTTRTRPRQDTLRIESELLRRRRGR